MTEALLALVPTYGLWLIGASVMLSCLALPLPSTILVMAAGGFAAAGDLVYWQLVLVAFGSFVIGDQAVYRVARQGGPALVTRIGRRARGASALASAERLVERFGVVAVFLSRTVLSPIGPWVGFLAGALRLSWTRFSVASTLGAICWSLAYSTLGYAFADRIATIAPLIGSSTGLVIAGSVAAGLAMWLARSWRSSRASGSATVRERTSV